MNQSILKKTPRFKGIHFPATSYLWMQRYHMVIQSVIQDDETVLNESNESTYDFSFVPDFFVRVVSWPKLMPF